MSDSPCRTGWKHRTLASLAEYLNGRAFREDEWGEDGLPIVRIEQINDPSAICDRYDGPILPQHQIGDGDLVFSWSATLKAVIWNSGPAALNQHLFNVVPHADVDLPFLKHLLDMNMERLAASSQGSTMKHVTRTALERYRACVPSCKAHQERIAEILSTVDEAIEGTEKLIAKHQQIKAGLMHDLFTRGLTPDGELRSGAKTLLARFGPIPEGWRVGSLLDIADPGRQPILTGPFGADLGSKDFVSEGTPVLRIGNVQAGHLDLRDLLYITSVKARELARYAVREGDLLFARQGATTGRNALATSAVAGSIINYHIIRVALCHRSCAPLFVEAAFKGEMVERQITREKGRGTREGIKTSQLAELRVPLAPLPEQLKIAQILGEQEARVAALRDESAKLRQIKRGLMHDLLTGEVPVSVSEADVYA